MVKFSNYGTIRTLTKWKWIENSISIGRQNIFDKNFPFIVNNANIAYLYYTLMNIVKKCHEFLIGNIFVPIDVANL